MSGSIDRDLLARLAKKTASGENGASQHGGAAATQQDPTAGAQPAGQDDKLEALLHRINKLTVESPAPAPAGQDLSPPAAAPYSPSPPNPRSPGGSTGESQPPQGQQEPQEAENPFVPQEITSLRHAGLSESDVESLVLKALQSRGDLVGRDLAEQVKLPFVLVEEILRQLKQDQLVVYRGSAPMNDYVYQLTDVGSERARRFSAECTYFGAAPVSLKDYVASIRAQSLEKQHPTHEDLTRAFDDLLINPHMLSRLGPAINSGRGLFLYGAPGNGKTSIAERVSRAFGEYIWIPRALGVDGEIIRLFDPMNHEEAPEQESEGLLSQSKIDNRWVRIRRPTIVVGGELTMSNLEVMGNPATGISEAPVQLKSNCGVLVIDDFGRQRMSIDELLNRWIVPLEKRYDFLNLPNGKKIQVPFDQLIVFSTNLEPRDLVDDAFLRRIPYKIEVTDPSEEEFRKLFHIMCPIVGFKYDQPSIDHLVNQYKSVERPYRCCQPRDLLLQIRNHCLYQKKELTLSPENFEFAIENYFAVM